MYHLTIQTHFAAAHNLLNYQGDCENLHGHNWKVEATVSTENLDKSGLGIDFKILKKHTKEIMNYLDHKYLNDLEAFKGISPSSEHIAKFIFDRLLKSLAEYEVTMEKITVWESDNAYASYTQS
ncbi:MAG: 6-carboxytetrahydropterin synthase QueD [Deltaproteobacteria bacterium]|jgi:6-pyruvoyltetrahydropterin/6-carboxytetrahydropterin synthase|nr:6-carboxytetrahydropterin synthase QueD [Deltaproteobacteria bacterium]MCW8893096.1 6-carboxytetrahydropterin synthase QueD [Deltaproteobacteria bacterium]MCW9049110.1 6-carboxytetrahydropterin synthase QueD [Deltaproteobacteria bacterium]